MEEQKEQLKLLLNACSIYASWQVSITKASGIDRATLSHLIGDKVYKRETEKAITLYYKAIKESRIFLAEKYIEANKLRILATRK